MLAPQRCLHRRENVVRHERDTEAEQRSLRVSQRLDLAVERAFEIVEHCLDRPAVAVDRCNANRPGIVDRQIRDDVEFRLAVANRCLERDRGSTQAKSVALGVSRLDLLLVDRRASAASAPLALPNRFPGQIRCVLADDKVRPLPRDAREQPTRAEVAVGDDQIPLDERRQHRVGQRSFLGMAVLAGHDVDRQHQARIEYDDTKAGQWTRLASPQHPQAPLGCCEMVAIEDLDPVAGKKRRQLAAHRLDHGRKPRRCVSHQRGRHAWLDAIELVVDRRQRHGDAIRCSLISRVHRRARIADHDAHQIDERGEQQLARVLTFRRLLEDRIDCRCCQSTLHHAARHYADRTLRRKPFENLPQHHATTPIRGGKYCNFNKNSP